MLHGKIYQLTVIYIYFADNYNTVLETGVR